MLQTDKPCHPLQVFFEDLVVGEFYNMIYGDYFGDEEGVIEYKITINRKIQLMDMKTTFFLYCNEQSQFRYRACYADFGLKPYLLLWNHYNYLTLAKDPYAYLKEKT